MRASLFLAAMFALAVAVPAAATQDDSLLTAALTQAPGKSLEALRVSYVPGEASKPHSHDRDAFVYVLSGRVRSQVEGQPLRVYAAGENWFEMGKFSFLDVLDARRTLIGARTQYLAALAQTTDAWVRIERIYGDLSRW